MKDCELYHKWLGIPPNEQPPNHYRLLGITPFESDPEVIEHASDQRLGHLRTLRASQHIDSAERMLNEVAAAKICLLRPNRKANYDAMLRASMQQPTAPPLSQAPHPATLPCQVAFSAPLPFPLRLPMPLPPQEVPPIHHHVFVDEFDYAPFVADPPPYRMRALHSARKAFNPMVVMAPICGILLVALIIAYMNLNSTTSPAAAHMSEPRSVSGKSAQVSRTSDPTRLDNATAILYSQAVMNHAPREPRMAIPSVTGIIEQVAERPNATYFFCNQLPRWSSSLFSQASAEVGFLEQWGHGLAMQTSRQLTILAKEPARIVSPIVLHFDEDETIFEVPIDARIPVDAALYVSAWIDTNPPMRKIVLPATPDPIVVTFAAKPHRMNTGLVVLRVSPRIGSGANEVPCNVKRFAKMADSLPGQIQEAQDKLSVLSKDISQAETKYDNLISQSGGANSAIIIAQQANVAAKARLAMLRGKQASLIRSGIRWKAQLEDLQKLIKVVRGYDGMTIQYRVYYLERKRQVVLIESSDDLPFITGGRLVAPSLPRSVVKPSAHTDYYDELPPTNDRADGTQAMLGWFESQWAPAWHSIPT